jgi:aconitate hydratase
MNTGLDSVKSKINDSNQDYTIFQLDLLPGTKAQFLEKLPFSIRILLEGVLRNINDETITLETAQYLANWKPNEEERKAIPVFPGRVVLQDFTGIPVMNDLAAMRKAMVSLGEDPLKVNPVIPVDLVIDHSVMVDEYGSADALAQNAEIEFKRNEERYQFLRWCEQAFTNFHVVPPATGIIHQVNLEYLAQSLLTRKVNGETLLYPDTLIGTDSHTTMINGLGVVGWGVGGIEAVAAMMGQPLEMLAPDVVGVRLDGRLAEGTTPTDLTLTVIEMLRSHGVVDKFVEVFGPGLDTLSLADRAMIANMTPECGATMIYFPVDEQTLEYLRLTGKSEDHIKLVEDYYKTQHLFRVSTAPDPIYSEVLELNLNTIEPSLAGPKRPQDRVVLSQVQANFRASLAKNRADRGFGLAEADLKREGVISLKGQSYMLKHGFLAIAAITSCTNTSNPTVMLAAGLLAKKAVELGLEVPAYVKTSLAPGSRVVSDYLAQSNLLPALEKLGFYVVGYGCTTCIGNSGTLAQTIIDLVEKEKLIAAAVLSGNRNFEGRVSPQTQANYLASPPLVVAYALAGTVNINLTSDALGYTPDGKPVFLRDIWPTGKEIQDVLQSVIKPEIFARNYANVYNGNHTWNAILPGKGKLYHWEDSSTYLQAPPFFESFGKSAVTDSIQNARVLLLLGDSVTTDHISPAGNIPKNTPAGQYLVERQVLPQDFNSFGSRRGNDRIMARGTFANIRLKNLLVPGVEGGVTLHLPDCEQLSVYAAAERYRAEGTPLLVIAGKEYGTGSSRDWAAKGPLLLGVKVILAESFERIHRSNLVGMGVLPLEFLPGENATSLGLDGSETYSLFNLAPLEPGKLVRIEAQKTDGSVTEFEAVMRINTYLEVQYFKDGGIMNTILLELAQ